MSQDCKAESKSGRRYPQSEALRSPGYTVALTKRDPKVCQLYEILCIQFLQVYKSAQVCDE